MSVNERTPDADFFTVICLQSLQTAEPGLQLQLISIVASRALTGVGTFSPSTTSGTLDKCSFQG